MSATARHARRRRLSAGAAALVAASLLSGLAITGVTLPDAAQAVEAVGASTSARTVAWAPRHPDDRADAANPAAHTALKDLRVRVSQTKDLLNQTVEVSFDGLGDTGTLSFLQLMQCWSDGPDVPPTREQCAYGGTDTEGAEGSAFLRTRQLSVDPRERTYRNDGGLNVVAVDGAVPTPTWTAQSEVVLGTNQQRCPAATTGFTAKLVPSRDAIAAGLAPNLRIEGPTDTPTASLLRRENGAVRTYSAVTSPFRLAQVAATQGLTELPLGQYRSELSCTGAAGDELARFVGALEQTKSGTARVWKPLFREGGVSVPFDPLGQTPDTAPTDPYARFEVLEYLKPRSTNEIAQVLRRPDGAGSASMELLTDLEAQHLGCGRVDPDRVRSCWLVAVPRWGTEPDGSAQDLRGYYSPMSQTLWDRRVEVPLGFAPVAAGCKIGSGLKQILTHDSTLNALRSWQPTFCGDSRTASSILGPLQDFSIRASLSRPNRLGVITTPPEGRRTVVTAPIATSGVVVAFSVDRQIAFGREDFALNGTRATLMNLNARLLAKLLTQSYDMGAAPNGGRTTGFNSPFRSGSFTPTYTPARSFPAANPRTLYDDPEFRRLNPDFVRWLEQSAGLSPVNMADVLVSANDTDAYQTLWRWILSDPAARGFLDGTADGDGMLVNPYYKGQIDQGTSSFPLLDPTCIDDLEDPNADKAPLLCQINNHPRVEDDGEAAQSAVRGDTRRVNVAPTQFTGAAGEILGFRAGARQQQGQIAMLVITTSSVAERFGLPTARLANADGEFVAADVGSMAKAREQMLSRADGVLLSQPGAVRAGGYPLTTNSYALVDVAATTQAQNDAFAAILDYAATDGQRPGTASGQLPPGYAPLTEGLRARTRAAALLLRDPSSLLPAPGPVAAAAGSGSLANPAARPASAASAPAPSSAGPRQVAPSIGPASPVPTARAGAAGAPPETRAPGVRTPTSVAAGARPQAPRDIRPRQRRPLGAIPVRDRQVPSAPLSGAGTGSVQVQVQPAVGTAAPSSAAPVLRPVVAANPVLTTSPEAPLRWVLPGLLVIALLAAFSGALLPRTPRRPSS